MKKRILSLLLALVMLLGMLPTVALAADDGWDGTTKTEPEKSGDVYQIGTAAALAWFRDEVNSGKSTLNATLTADIDLNNQEWTPIGQGYSAQFTGTFDGNQHTISGLKIDKTTGNAMGLFGSISSSAMIKNLIVKGSITVIASSTSSMPVGVGGVVGEVNGASTLSQVASYVDVTLTSDAAYNGYSASMVGGLVGNGYSTTIQSCANYGTVTGNGAVHAGGLSGMPSWSSIKIENSLNAGLVTGTAKFSGGLIPLALTGTTVTNSATLGEPTGKLGGTFTNCFATANTIGATGVTVKTQAELKSDEVLAALNAGDNGNAFVKGDDGLPVLSWMKSGGSDTPLAEPKWNEGRLL